MTDHSITPPPELVQKWANESPMECSSESWAYEMFIAYRAAQWGADQELKACCEWLEQVWFTSDEHEAIKELRSERRPKSLTLKEQGLQALGRFNSNAHTNANEMMRDFDLIRRALQEIKDED